MAKLALSLEKQLALSEHPKGLGPHHGARRWIPSLGKTKRGKERGSGLFFFPVAVKNRKALFFKHTTPLAAWSLSTLAALCGHNLTKALAEKCRMAPF